MEDARAWDLEVTRTARVHLAGRRAGTPSEVWILLHGYGQLAADMLGACGALDDGERLLVAPEGLSRFYGGRGERGHGRRVGASWMTSEHREAEIADYVAYLDLLHARILEAFDAGSSPLHLLGFSQGASTAWRWAALGRPTFRRLVAWAGDVPPDLDLTAHAARLRPAAPVLVLGRDDTTFDERRLAGERARLEAAGITHGCLRFDGGHEIDAATLAHLAAGA